jgi:hypothetical protein
MLVRMLRLFGLDVPAKIEEATAGLELRVEQATDYVKQVAEETAMIAAFYLVATVAAASAACIGLMAVYRWMTDDYGPYVGLATDGAVLLVFAAICAGLAVIRRSSLAGRGTKSRVRMFSKPAAIAVEAPPLPPRPAATVADLADPLSLILSRYVKSMDTSNPVINGLVGKLGAIARGTTDETLERAAYVVRHGDTTNVFSVLIGAAVLAWMLTPARRAELRSD